VEPGLFRLVAVVVFDEPQLAAVDAAALVLGGEAGVDAELDSAAEFGRPGVAERRAEAEDDAVFAGAGGRRPVRPLGVGAGRGAGASAAATARGPPAPRASSAPRRPRPRASDSTASARRGRSGSGRPAKAAVGG